MRQREKPLSCLFPWARHISRCSTGTGHSISEPKVSLDDMHLLNSKKETREMKLGHLSLPQHTVCTSCNIFCLSVLSLWGPAGRLVVLRLYAYRQTACRQPTSASFTILPLIYCFYLSFFPLAHSLTETLFHDCFISFSLVCILHTPPSFSSPSSPWFIWWYWKCPVRVPSDQLYISTKKTFTELFTNLLIFHWVQKCHLV